MSGYTDQEISAIGQWLRDGLSASKVAEKLSIARRREVSRNAIIGIVKRNKALREIGFTRKAGEQRPGDNPRRAATPERSAPAVARLPARRIETPSIELVAAPSPQDRMPFLAAATSSRCLFFACEVFAPDGPDMPVCGGERQTHTRKPYCEFHLRAEVAA